KRIAIMGGSFGGYATLRGVTETPELFACGVDIVGPSDLALLFRTMPSLQRRPKRDPLGGGFLIHRRR
ncbi:MAG TPA: prolyl oligopeptidase family serine peptidase, partial [Burkholderiales bacterium]|nr:prolyl oligopeptidase family serine peptidase [Burkholderiales bacterium]